MPSEGNSDALRAYRKKSNLRSLNRLLNVMNHQRILVLAIAVAQTALSHFILFLVCLGLIHAKEIANIMLLDRLDQREREEYYETPKIHGVSINDIRFMEADQLVTYILVVMYIATAFASIYALCTLALLIGTIKRRCELMLPWIAMHTFICVLNGMGLVLSLLYRNQYVDDVFGDGSATWFLSAIVFLTNIFLWYVVRGYYDSLKMMKRLTDEVVLPIPCPVVPFHFRKENMFIGNGGYKHLLSDSNPNCVI